MFVANCDRVYYFHHTEREIYFSFSKTLLYICEMFGQCVVDFGDGDAKHTIKR